MCGIAGILALGGAPPALDELRAMAGAMVHRGPDSEGYYLSGPMGLVMCRLSIIDLATGSQPVRNEDSTVWTVFNGEIYNHARLRRRLAAAGHVFYTATDTETLVHLYEDHGARCLEHLRGMFGLAIWDDRRQKLLLARDRLGIKPLYYTEQNGRLIFASELKCILQLPEVARELDWSAVQHLFTSLSTPPATSIVAGVRKLEPGRALVAGPAHPPRLRRYYDFRIRPDYGKSEGYFAERLLELLEESVRLHMVSDVPVGAFLSGGVDSSAVVATMVRLGAGRVKTFSIGFSERSYDESAHARRMARLLGTEHHELILEPDVLSILEPLTWHLDEPFGDISAIPTYMVSRLAAEHVKVVLSGDGGDELFAGYDRYVVEQQERHDRLPPGLRRLCGALARRLPDGLRGRNRLWHLSLDDAERYLDAGTLFRREQHGLLFRPDVLERIGQGDPWGGELERLRGGSGHWLSALQSLDVRRYLPLDILPKVDRMSMAHSIEARVPLLDHKLVELAARIPPELQLRGRTTKALFKHALRRLLPADVLERPKQGFAVPLGAWFRGGFGGFVRDLLLEPRTRERRIFNPRYVERLLARHARGRDLDLQLWTMISFELWCRTFLDGAARPPAGRPAPRPLAAPLPAPLSWGAAG